jgi:hypothetical protein
VGQSEESERTSEGKLKCGFERVSQYYIWVYIMGICLVFNKKTLRLAGLHQVCGIAQKPQIIGFNPSRAPVQN